VPDPTGRHQAFANFVREALTDARTQRGWNGSEVARRTGLSRQTINRWLRSEWTSDPEPARVVAFCEALGITPTYAFGILGWDRSAVARPTALPPPMDPDVEALLRRLVDPSVPETEKYHMRETIRYLAYRPSPPDRGDKQRRVG
jgi:transcriptional regulator with XRE-family HTH domain